MCWNVYLWLASQSLSLVNVAFSFSGFYLLLSFFLNILSNCNPNNTNKLYLAGNKISTQTGIGTVIAIAGVAIYSFIKAKLEEEKRVSHRSYTPIDILKWYRLTKIQYKHIKSKLNWPFEIRSMLTFKDNNWLFRIKIGLWSS